MKKLKAFKAWSLVDKRGAGRFVASPTRDMIPILTDVVPVRVVVRSSEEDAAREAEIRRLRWELKRKRGANCRHPKGQVKPMEWAFGGGAFGFGPREWRCLAEWCEECGAVRARAEPSAPWTEWQKRKGGAK